MYALWRVTVGTEVTQVAQPMSPAAESVIGPVAETATVPEAFGRVMVRAAVGSVTARTVLYASAVAPSKESGLPPVTFPEAKETLPVVTVKPFEAVSRPAEVIVPVPVVLMLLEVVMAFAVLMLPKPEAIEPEASAPTVVIEVVTTFEAKVVPLMSAAAFTVIVAFGKVMVLEEVVGSVIAKIVLYASAVAPSKESGLAPVTFPEAKETLPVVTVKPFEAVSRPAEVIVPVPVVEMLLEVLIVEAVAIEPKPEAIEPEASAPTVVTEVVTTLAASVVPLMLAAAFTVIEASGKVMVRAAVGSVMAKTVLLTSAVAPSKESGEAPVMLPEAKAMLPFPVNVWVTVRLPFTVEVAPVLEIDKEVALVVPRFNAAAESTESAPAEVEKVEAAPPVKVRAPPEVKEEAPVGVRFTEPAPEAVKLPEVRVKAMSCDEEVVIV